MSSPDQETDPQHSETLRSERLREARQRAVGWLSRREYAGQELLQKLARAGYEADLAQELLDWLLAHDLLSDERFAESFVRSRQRQGYGPLRVRLELRQRGVDAALTAQALSQAEMHWGDVAARAYGKRFGSSPCESLKERARRQQFLYRRGFDPEQIAAAVAANSDSDDED